MINHIELFLDGNRGIYMPQAFAQCADRTKWHGVSYEEWAILEAGPDHEQYWDVWADVCSNAIATDSNGYTFRIHLGESGDVFIYCVELITQAEEIELFGLDWALSHS